MQIWELVYLKNRSVADACVAVAVWLFGYGVCNSILFMNGYKNNEEENTIWNRKQKKPQPDTDTHGRCLNARHILNGSRPLKRTPFELRDPIAYYANWIP